MRLRNVSVTYGSGDARIYALQNVTAEFEPAALTLVIGPSGSGKTTLLSLMGGLLNPDEGDVEIHGERINGLTEESRAAVRRRHIGFVFQAFRLFPVLNALENVLLPLEIAGTRDKAAVAAARKLLTDMGLERKMHEHPKALSGGEKQRVAIARALIRTPSVVLADEPTASLDSASGEQIARMLRNLAAAEGRTVVVVSHDPRWRRYADRIVALEDGKIADGRENRA